jgi:hypothetical protein
MSSTIFASKKRKRNVAASEKDNSDVEDDFADESDVDKYGEGSDSEEPEDEDDGYETVDDFQGKAFDISRTVNLESGDLADVLSEKDSPVPMKVVAKKTPAPVAAPKVLSEEDWEM